VGTQNRGEFAGSASAAVTLAAMLLLAACSSGTGTTTATTAATTTASSAAASEAPAATSTTACAPAPTATGASTGPAAAAVLSATQAFLGTLDDAQKTSVAAERTASNLAQWSNLPDQLFERAGLRMDSLGADQQAAVMKVLQAALSPEGFTQVTQISTADGVLAAEGGIDLDFGADHYWIRILGTPAATGEWTVQYGGHHLAVNVTMAGQNITLAPTLWGAQPASYAAAGNTAEPLCGETTKAFALVDALDADQQKAAILTTPIKEIVLGAGQDGKTLAAEGVKASTFTEAQRTLLLDLVDEWIRPLNSEAAAAKLAAAQQNLDQTTFAWYGSTEIGNPIYYRVQGPTFTIEFAHQQGQGANAGGITHIHSIYREPGNDYGAQLGS
jgi:Protein of unknown function (DUF3500)